MDAMLDRTGASPAVDRAAAEALRDAIVLARRRLHDVLHDRAASADHAPSWTGAGRRGHDDADAALRESGRALDTSLRSLLAGVEHELRLLDAASPAGPLAASPGTAAGGTAAAGDGHGR